MIKANFSTYGKYVTDSLYQWDINRLLVIKGLNLDDAPEIHFFNSNMARAIVRQATLEEDGSVNVIIPNALLQEALLIKANVVVYEGDARKTIETIEIPVTPKARPSDYSLTDSDEDVYSFNRLENMINNTVKEASDQYEKATENYNRVINRFDDISNPFYGLSSYLTFVASQDSDTLDASFGKNNEDMIRGVGTGLAMYGWFKGLDKTVYPFTNLCRLQTLNDMNMDVYKEIVSSDLLFWFITASSYATDKMFSKIQANSYLHNDDIDRTEVVVNFEVTDEDLTVPFGFKFSASTTSSNVNDANIYINDVLAQSFWKQTDGTEKSSYGFEEWSKYNITKPGTYSIKTVLDIDSLNKHWIDTSFSIYKPKEY